MQYRHRNGLYALYNCDDELLMVGTAREVATFAGKTVSWVSRIAQEEKTFRREYKVFYIDENLTEEEI